MLFEYRENERVQWNLSGCHFFLWDFHLFNGGSCAVLRRKGQDSEKMEFSTYCTKPHRKGLNLMEKEGFYTVYVEWIGGFLSFLKLLR